jgi:putative ABC transport system permease protein
MLRIALKFLFYDKAKSLGALLGIIISTFLIGQQTGIFLYLTDSMAALASNARADLWVVDDKTTDINSLALLDARKGRELASVPGVARAFPVVVSGGSARFRTGKNAGVQVIGSEAPVFPAGPWNLETSHPTALLREGAVSADRFDSKALGGATLGTEFEISGKRAFIATQTAGARGFGAIYLFTTLERARYYGNVPRTKVSALLLHVQPGADPRQVRDRINASINGVRAWLPQELGQSTKRTLLAQSGIGVSTGTLIAFALVAGFFIIGLTLYSSAIDRLRDYGTLKAIGADNSFIRRLILLQAVLLAVLGFALGYAAIEGFRFGIGRSGALFAFTWPIRLGFIGITLLISLTGAVFAIRRITQVEPASVFRG